MSNIKYLYTVVIVAVLLLTVATWFFYERRAPENEVSCTMEAMICPDGTAVGRTGPNCAFAACPDFIDPSWNTYQDVEQGIEFRYPELATTYFTPLNWPPRITLTSGTFMCEERDIDEGLGTSTRSMYLTPRDYCVSERNEGAAGSIYRSYRIETTRDDHIVTVEFTMRLSQCANYEEEEQRACESENISFNIEEIIHDIVGSIKTFETGEVGIITQIDSEWTRYTNNRYGFQFTYPSSWRVGDNRLGLGTFQLMNYHVDEVDAGHFFPEGTNKIEIGIGSADSWNQHESDFPSEHVQVESLAVDGVMAKKVSRSGGINMISYYVSLTGEENEALVITIHGDPDNFVVLEDIMKTFTWIQ